MWLAGACVCAFVYWVAGETKDFVDYSGDYSANYSDDYSAGISVHDSWNRLYKLLLGNHSAQEDPWKDSKSNEFQSDQPVLEVRDISAASLIGLNDEEIWEKVIGSDDQSVNGTDDKAFEDVMLKDDEKQLLDSSNKTESPPITHSDEENVEKHDKDIATSLSVEHNSENSKYTISHNNDFTTPTFNSTLSSVSESVEGHAKRPNASVLRETGERALDGLLRDGYVSDEGGGGPGPGRGQAGTQSTLAFVFDTTGSMWDDLVQVRHGAAKIMETMLQRADRPIYDYVLVPFHDPLIGPVTVTTDHMLLKQRLNEIQIYGGGDCPEASVGAVQQALQLSRPNSYIYVFTDARAKDHHLITQVLPLIQRKQSQVVFVMTGDCGDQSHPGYQVYHKIAATSSGQVYHLNKTDVDEVLSFVRVSLQSRKVNLMSVERPAANSGADLPLPIDQTLREFTVSVSGSNASIGVVDPGGRKVQPPQLTPLLDLQNVKVVNVKEPPPGVYTLQVGSDSQHTVRTTGLSGSDFVHGFSVIPTTNMAETYHRPLKSGSNSVLIRATEPENLHNLTNLELVHLNGSVVDSIVLCPVPGQPGLYSGGPFIPPTDFFYLSVSGYGNDNFPVKRITATAISAQPPELPTVSMALTYTRQAGQPLTLTCRVESLVPFTVRWYKDGAVKTRMITYNQTADVEFKIATVSKSDAGRYTCKAQIPNIIGFVSKDTKLHVTGPPPRVETQKEVVTKVGARTELKCGITSEVAYNISWQQLVTTTPQGTSGSPTLVPVTVSPEVEIHSNNSLVIPSTQLSHEGWYICTVYYKGGQQSGRVYVSVLQPPAVRVSPSQQEFTTGSWLDLHCHLLAGIPDPSVTWTKDNVMMQDVETSHDQTRWTLRLKNLKRENAGLYSCEASNVVGSAHGTVELSLLEPPEVRAETDSQLVRQGDTTLLRCLASGSPPPQLTWYKDGTIISSDQGNIHILKNGELEIQEADLGDAGQYSCVVRNKAGTSKDSVLLQVGSPPRVVHLPNDLALPIGGTGSLLCAAVGVPTPETTWTKGDKPVLQSSRVVVSEHGEIFFKDSQLEDEGDYACTVENIYGKATYHVAVKVTGIVGPKLQAGSLPENTKALKGSTVQLGCPVLRGHPPPVRVWYKDGSVLNTAQYHISPDGNLLLANLSTVDAGMYECVISNVGGKDSLATTLDVLEPPRILLSPQEEEVKAVEGSSVTLPCPVSGDPLPSVFWLWHGKRMHESQAVDRSLQLRNVSVYQSGSYTCLASSPAGTDSRSITLSVLVPPEISQWKGNITVSEGHYTRLECHVTAIPPANISWYHEEQLLPFRSSSIWFPANKSMEGQYKCVAENEVGSSTQLMNLFVAVVPRIDPLAPKKYKAGPGITVALLCPSMGEPKPTVTWSKVTSQTTRLISESDYLELKDISPSEAGTYLCIARNVAGTAELQVTVEYIAPPVVINWQEEMSVLEDQEVSLACVTGPEQPANITWIRNELPLSINGAIFKFIAKREDAGNYTCVATNEAGSDKKHLFLAVIAVPKILNNEEEYVRLFKNMSEAHLSCENDGLPQPTLSWFKDSVNITHDKGPQFRMKGSNLTLSNPSQDLAGMYLCHAENIAGIAQKIFEVEFYEPPEILEQSLTNITLREGDDYTIPCTGSGVPTPSVSWRFGEMSLSSGFQTDEVMVLQDKLLVLTQVSAASEGEYSCVAESPAGRANRTYSVHVVVPPVAVDRSVTQLEVLESNTGLLTCPVQHGSPQTSIQWLKDGVPISLAKNERADDAHYNLNDGGRSLKIVEATSDDGGMYSCIATNLAGRSQAMFAVEVMVYPHFIDEFPEHEFVVSEGERLVLDCSVGGNPEPKVSWKRVELGLPVTQHTTPGVMLELPKRWRLVITAVKPHHSGTYQCTAVNKLSRVSRQFSVRVTVPPELDGPREESLDVALNETVTLQCRVWGIPTPQITWQYANSSTDFQKIQNLGFDMRLLELSRMNSAQAGIYKCSADNALGSVFKLFNVTISEPPRIERSEIVEDVKVGVGHELTLACVVSGSPTPIVSWLYNGHVVDSPITSPAPRTHQLTVGPTQHGSGGKYSCVASNKAGVAEKTFKVKVLVPPRISGPYQFSADPQLVVVEGLPLTIRCPVTGSPPPDVSWLKDNKLTNHTSELIVIKTARPSDAGNYTCTASNHVGTVSKTFLVDVHRAPVLKEGGRGSEQHLEVLSKSRLELDCSVSAHPAPSVLWLRGAEPLPLHSPAVTLSKNNQSLVISSVGLEHSGQYSCLASNIAGAVEKTFNVNVLEAPSKEEPADEAAAPTEQKVMLHRKLVLECPVSGAPQPNITWYKDGELVKGQQVSERGRFLHMMSVAPRDGGNYSCVAENQAGTTQLFLPVYIVVPLQWTEWTQWTPCSKSCGGGKELRERQCGYNTTAPSEFVEFDDSDCVGESSQSRPCNVLPCQIHGSWSEWTSWTSCSESCGPGSRRRYRHCDSPTPAFGGNPCLGSDGQQEPCIIQSCPLQSNWGEWTEWSRCTAKCGVGTKFRARLCLQGDDLAQNCKGQNKEVTSCSSRKCPVDGKWTTWGPWSQCSVTCGNGLRQRQRLCSKRLYGGKPCLGDNIQIEKCELGECGLVPLPLHLLPPKSEQPKSASLRIRGKLNGERVHDMYLDADIREEGPKRYVTATLSDILKAQANWFPYLTFLMPPVSLNTASEKEKAKNAYSLTNGNFTEESRFQFATGQELVVKHKGKGVDPNGALKVDIEVMGDVPLLQPTSSVIINPYTEDYIQTGPNSLYTASNSSLDIDGEKVPFEWNRTVVYDMSQGTMPYLVERLSTDEIASEYNPKRQQLNFKVSSEISKKYNNKCPLGFKLDSHHHHCSDIDECKEWKKACLQNQICENQFGSYRCLCQEGFRLSPNGRKCVDVNECVERRPCSHNCHNTRGSFYCSCPPQLALSHTGLTCKAWGDLDMEDSNEDYIEEDTNEAEVQFVEAKAMETVACRPGLLWKNGSCADENECLMESPCEEQEICINTFGSFHCLGTPCVDSQWDPVSRSCVKVCGIPKAGCEGETTVAEFAQSMAVTVNSSSLQPYQLLGTLRPHGLHNEPLTRTVYDITENTEDVPVRIRIENGQGILYAMKYFQMSGIFRISIKASSFSKDYKTELYRTHFEVFLNAD